MVDALIIDACRTPRCIGKAGKGALSGIHPQQLGAAVLRALADRTGIDTADVDDIIWGTSSQRGPQSGDLGRMSALDAGYDVRASGVTLDRFCGSGITSAGGGSSARRSGSSLIVPVRYGDHRTTKRSFPPISPAVQGSAIVAPPPGSSCGPSFQTPSVAGSAPV